MKTTNLYKDLAYDKNKPLITVLFETGHTKEVRIAMHQGTVMKEHKTPYNIVVEVVEGSVDFGVFGKVEQLLKGDLIALEGDVPHSLEARQDSIVRLTLSKHDDIERVKKVGKA